MVSQSGSNAQPLRCDFSQRRTNIFISFCPCAVNSSSSSNEYHPLRGVRVKNARRALLRAQARVTGGTGNPFNTAARSVVLKRFSDEEEYGVSSFNASDSESNYYINDFGRDPIVEKLRNQLGAIHPLPSPPPVNRNIVGLFGFFFLVGVGFDKLWTLRRKSNATSGEGKEGRGSWAQVPGNLSLFLEKDLQRKESVEWVNMVLGKLWKVYRGGLENWVIGLLQPVIDNLKKPDYVERVEIKQFSLGDEPLSVRSVERRTSRRANDLQYQIGLRYTGGARMLLSLSLKFGILPIVVPVGVRDFDIDGELWVKLRLVPTEPWVGGASWAFVSLPKIKFELSPFRLFNIMAIPVLSMFLTNLLTKDLPNLFVRPKKIVLDFQNGKAVGPVPNDSKSGENLPNDSKSGENLPNDSKSGENQEGNNEFAGELSVTLLDARKLSYIFYGKTDPYVILKLGDQVIRSKKNSQTTVIGPPGEPIWNQDFHMLVGDPRKEKLWIEVKDSLGFTDLTVGTAEVDLGSLKDTVPADRVVVLKRGWSLFGNDSAGAILLRLTYKAYVEDEEDEKSAKVKTSKDDELSDSDVNISEQRAKESFMDVLAALLVSEEFRGILTSDTLSGKTVDAAGISGTTLEPESEQQIPAGNGSSTSQGSTLLWFAFITSVSVLIALNMGGVSLFNP